VFRYLVDILVSVLQSDTQICAQYRIRIISFVTYLNARCDNLNSPRNQVLIVTGITIRRIWDSPNGGCGDCCFTWCDAVYSDMCGSLKPLVTKCR
jgi:hypothetical protein